jgi:hypothetical protein
MKTILFNVESSIKPFTGTLRQAAETIKEQDVSNYPIFVVHKGETIIGLPLLTAVQTRSEWEVNASTLEEFVAKQLIATEKLDDFRALYKKNSKEICLFISADEGASFAFIK